MKFSQKPSIYTHKCGPSAKPLRLVQSHTDLNPWEEFILFLALVLHQRMKNVVLSLLEHVGCNFLVSANVVLGVGLETL